MPTTRLTEVEREYFVRVVGGAPVNEPLNNIKRRYMSSVVGSAATSNASLDQIEKLWLLDVRGNQCFFISGFPFNMVGTFTKTAILFINLSVLELCFICAAFRRIDGIYRSSDSPGNTINSDRRRVLP